jgi:hypothetical protein
MHAFNRGSHERRRASSLAIVALTLASFWAGATSAATKPPDLSGFWFLARGKIERMPELVGKLAPDAVSLSDIGARELPPGDFGGLKVKPAARAAAAQWNPAEEQSVANVCKPPSIIYSMQGPFPIEIHPATELVVFKLEYYDQVRIIFMDGRAHPGADYPHSKAGHSIGRWDGDTLVVDTTHLEPSTITNNGLNHSDKVHVIERFRLSADGKFLHMTQEFDDPEVLDGRGSRYVVLERQKGHVFPYECDPSYGLSMDKRERK